jgi:DNA-binding transcriptional MerR regulator
MLIKIGDVTNKLGITHRSLHYWESIGILESTRGENDYRYYDDENIKKIKQIVLLRKLRLSIPSIQEIFTSNELSKIIMIFTSHLDESKKEKEQLNALGIVLKQLINMLRDKQNIESVYNYLNTTHTHEAGELKSALQMVLSEQVNDISLPEPEPQLSIVDMSITDLSLELMTQKDINMVTEVVKHCYSNTDEIEKLLYYFDFSHQLYMPDCACYYKILQKGVCIGAVNLAYVGREAMLIRCLAYDEPDMNIFLFELLKQKHPDIQCWMIRNAPDNKEDFNYDWEMKKQQFWEDNGFIFYTDARYNQFIKMMSPHDEVYNSSKYRFALLDGSMDDVSFRFFGLNRLDFYDGAMPNCRFTDVNFSETLIYNTWMAKSRFYESGIDDSDFRYTSFDKSTFIDGSFQDCEIRNCIIKGLTIDGINVEAALDYYKNNNGVCFHE